MINQIAYEFTKEKIGLREIDGVENHPMIVLSHHLTGHSTLKPSKDVDSTIPWCSSWVNFAVVVACIRTNPKRAFEMLQAKGFSDSAMVKCFDYAGVSYGSRNYDTGDFIEAPTWSAASRSWDNWGVAVPFDQARKGDLVRLTRDGGGHICFLDEDELGKIYLRVLGGNQSNKICSANNYLRSRVVCVRRGKVPLKKVEKKIEVESKKEIKQPEKKKGFFSKLKKLLKFWG
jgi:hypothetical protein